MVFYDDVVNSFRSEWSRQFVRSWAWYILLKISFVYQFHDDVAVGSNCFTMSFDSYEGHYGVNIFIHSPGNDQWSWKQKGASTCRWSNMKSYKRFHTKAVLNKSLSIFSNFLFAWSCSGVLWPLVTLQDTLPRHKLEDHN